MGRDVAWVVAAGKGKSEGVREGEVPFGTDRRKNYVPHTCGAWGSETRTTYQRARGHATVHYTARGRREVTYELSRSCVAFTRFPQQTAATGTPTAAFTVANASLGRGCTLICDTGLGSWLVHHAPIQAVSAVKNARI